MRQQISRIREVGLLAVGRVSLCETGWLPKVVVTHDRAIRTSISCRRRGNGSLLDAARVRTLSLTIARRQARSIRGAGVQSAPLLVPIAQRQSTALRTPWTRRRAAQEGRLRAGAGVSRGDRRRGADAPAEGVHVTPGGLLHGNFGSSSGTEKSRTNSAHRHKPVPVQELGERRPRVRRPCSETRQWCRAGGASDAARACRRA
jgi:hypothetical protein